MKEPPLPLQFVNKQEFIFIGGSQLPHWNQQNCVQFVTFRLADSLPQQKLQEYREMKAQWEKSHPKPWDEATKKEYNNTFATIIDKWIDAGYGDCILQDCNLRDILANTILRYNGDRYIIHAFVIMPNHVHVLFSPRESNLVQDIVGGWKKFSAMAINRQMECKGKKIWEHDSFDHMVRSWERYQETVKYITRNPQYLLPGTYTLYIK